MSLRSGRRTQVHSKFEKEEEGEGDGENGNSDNKPTHREEVIRMEQDTQPDVTVHLGFSSNDGLRSIQDPTLIRDSRVLANVLLAPDLAKIRCANYFEELQMEVKPHMRKIVTEWMLEVAEDQGCQPDVFPLAVSYMDRVLARVAIKKSQFQLLACVCLFIASKFKETSPLCIDKLVVYTDFSTTDMEIRTWELLILELLHWDLHSITAQCIASQIIHRLHQSRCPMNLAELQNLTSRLTALAITEFSLVSHLDSVQLGTASLVMASQILEAQQSGSFTPFSEDLQRNLSIITKISRKEISHCIRLIESQISQDVEVSTLDLVKAPVIRSAPGQSPHNKKYAKTCNDQNSSLTTTPTDLLSMVVI
eukprot:maker-scaffold96_size378025-snap-gene-2.40 protein:Tk04990 transcript:maker-scaffold96_size378025-snap-gene-2.40-mRNA-1 annotation:"cyclin d3"